jgi:hypothetical protein
MKSAFFLLLRLICYATLAVALIALAAWLFITVNGECPPLSFIGVTCKSRFSDALADFVLQVAELTLMTWLPALLALGGLAFLVRDSMRPRGR